MELKTKRRQSWVMAVLFCLLIFGLAAATALKAQKEFSETENRVLAQRPLVKAETIWSGEFEADYEEYLTDQFVWRDQWVSLKTTAERLLLKRESKDIYFAEDGYLIEKHTGSYETQTAERNLATLAAFVQQYGERFGEGHLSVLIVPNAVDILTDCLPLFAAPGGGRDYLEQMERALPQEVWLDTAEILEEHAGEDLYYRTDHHWKTLAAFYVYQAWAKKQGYHVPELSDYEIVTVTDCFEGTIQSKLGIRTKGDTIELFLPIEEPSYVVKRDGQTENSLYDYTALDTKDKYAIFFGGNAPLFKVTTGTENGHRLLVIKDSYANCFLPFLLGEFEEIDVVDLRYTSRKLGEQIEAGVYTDLLVLYNVSGFAEDMSIARFTN